MCVISCADSPWVWYHVGCTLAGRCAGLPRMFNTVDYQSPCVVRCKAEDCRSHAPVWYECRRASSSGLQVKQENEELQRAFERACEEVRAEYDATQGAS